MNQLQLFTNHQILASVNRTILRPDTNAGFLNTNSFPLRSQLASLALNYRHEMADRLAMHTQLAGDLAGRPAFGRQRGNGMLQAHIELVHRAKVAGFHLPLPGRF